MCGIAGFLQYEQPASAAVVRRMCDAIRHRGPDDEGVHVDRGCGIGMRRLSIIDLSGGHQPIPNEDKSRWIVFNGEVYNFQDLRPKLEAAGHQFRTRSDTETILHLHEQDGLAAISQLRGMFAYALWDSRRQELLLVRDRFGKKPLYYAALPHGLYFASELKSLWPAGVPRDRDDEALRTYLQFGYIPDPQTAYRAIRKLPPASWLRVDAKGKIEQGSYWRLPAPNSGEAPASLRREEVCERIRAEFDEAVRLRMIADVPIGAFLSGGIDSSLVVASMARHSNRPVRTFSIGFDSPGFLNELPYARLVADRYQTEHTELVVQPKELELASKVAAMFDEPFADASALPTFLVSEMTVRSVKVALSGDGGDELFGGYHSFFEAEQRRSWDRIPAWIRGGLGPVSELLPYSAYGKNFLRAFSRSSSLERYAESISFTSHFQRERLFAPAWLRNGGAARLRQLFGEAILEGADPLSEAMYFEATAKLAGDILTKVDRTSMAASLEVRCPLLDHVLAEFAMTIPNAWKTQGGKGKLILVEAFTDRLPPELLDRPKWGFGMPLDGWFRGPLKTWLWDSLRSASFRDSGLVNAASLEDLLTEHDSGRRNNSVALWLLVVLAQWLAAQEQAAVAA